MGNGKMRTAVRKRVGRGFAKRRGAIGRQRAQRNVPTLVAQPFLDVSAGARYFEGLIVLLDQDDMVGEPAKASQHHIFIAGQLFAGPQRGLPLALQNRDIIEHFGIEFPR